MENLRGLFDALYDRLVLRDFFGKIVPGLVLLSTIYFCFARWQKVPSSIGCIENIPSFAWLAIFGLAWMLTFSVQAFGESCGKTYKRQLIHYYPPEEFDNDKKFLEFKGKFNEVAYPDEKRQMERFVVIKEACGNGYVTILISFLLSPVLSYNNMKHSQCFAI